MNKSIIEDNLVEIILEPDEYGIEDVRAQRDLVIEKLKEMGAEASEANEVYERIMASETERVVKEYFIRNLAASRESCTTLYYTIEDFAHLWNTAGGKKWVKRSTKFLTETIESLEDAMLCLEYLTKALAKTPTNS